MKICHVSIALLAVALLPGVSGCSNGRRRGLNGEDNNGNLRGVEMIACTGYGKSCEKDYDCCGHPDIVCDAPRSDPQAEPRCLAMELAAKERPKIEHATEITGDKRMYDAIFDHFFSK